MEFSQIFFYKEYMKFKALFLFLIFSPSTFGIEALPKEITLSKLPHCPKHINFWCKVKAEEISPTQPFLGVFHAQKKIDKLDRWIRDGKRKKIIKLLRKKTTGFILGPKSKFYINDRHHHGLSILKSKLANKEKYLVGKLIADYSFKSEQEFWNIMKKQSWAFLKDQNFKELHYEDLPSKLLKMEDFPLRSMVSILLDEKGYGKKGIPFEEFRYAEFLSNKLKFTPENTQESMQKAVEESKIILQTKEGLDFMNSLNFYLK